MAVAHGKAAAPPPAAVVQKVHVFPAACETKTAPAPPPAKADAPAKADGKKVAGAAPAKADGKKVAGAVAAADADAGMQAIDLKERRNLWMKYLRTRQVGNTGGRDQKSGGAGEDKVPENMRDAVEADPKKFFAIWAKKRSWKSVEFEESQNESSHNNTETEASWIWDFELERDYPNHESLRRALRGGPCHRQYPGTEDTEDDALSQWNIIDKDRTIMGTNSASSRSRVATGDQNSMDDATMAALNQSFPGEQEQKRDNEKTPEEIAAEADVAEARKKALAAKKLEPEFQIKAYVRSLPKDIMTARKTLDEINNKTSHNVPSGYSEQLQKSFNEHITTLVGHRSRLEGIQSTSAYDHMKLPEIKLAVIKMQHDTKAWKEMKELYALETDHV